jgi:hypothetical protein
MSSRLVLCLAILLFPLASQASGTEDVIITTDGAILRGHVSELRPGKSATIVLLDGRTRTLSWSEIAKSEGPSFPEARPAATEEDDRINPLEPGPGRVPLVVESAGRQQSISLHFAGAIRINGWGVSVTARICDTPCTMYLPPGGYVLQSEADGVVAARTPVTVSTTGGRVKLKAPPSGVRAGGVALVAIGSAAILAGAMTMAMEPIFGTVTDYSAPGDSTYNTTSGANMIVGGGITMGLGAAMIVPGAIMIAKTKGGIAEESAYENAPNRQLQVNAGASHNGGWLGATVRF